MDTRCCAYSFLKETSRMCDYEVCTDELASMVGYAINDVKHVPELGWIVEMVYHLNGSIRGRVAIEQSDIEQLNTLYEHYLQLVGPVKIFVVPSGNRGGSMLHILRSKAKSVLRIAYAIDREEKKVDTRILDFFNLLSNTFFMMALYENKKDGYVEKEFISKSYGR